MGLVGDADAEGAAKEGRAARGGEEEDEAATRSYHDTILSGEISQAVRRATRREGGGCLFLNDQYTNTGRPVAEVFREKHQDMHVPPVENPVCVAF